MRSADTQQPISKSYLKSLIVKCALIFTGGILITGVILFFSMQQPLGPSYGESFRILSTFKQEILFQSILIYAFTIGVVLAGIVAITLLYSHRVVGPIYRLNMFVKRIAEGDVSKTTSLRQKDVIHSLADEINTMVLSYQTTLNALKEKNNKLVQLTKLEEKEKNDEPERLHAELASNVREIDKIVNAIKI